MAKASRTKSVAKTSSNKSRPQVTADPKTTHPPAARRREKPTANGKPEASYLLGRKLDALPDRIDVRDWIYQPTLQALPNRLIHCHEVPEILNQGSEGACTGFALAAVINFLLARRAIGQRVSPYMLYSLARRYDEWPGETYDGSSARGAMKGWVRHGVCCADSWKASHGGLRRFTAAIAKEALEFPGGAFYRVMHKQVRDMHAALAETGALYCTLMVHGGWSDAALAAAPRVPLAYDDRDGNTHQISVPVIVRPSSGRADAGHAVAIVGYTAEGFIVQNSWGSTWGERGFALLPYDDYLMHATDVWVAQLGVPVTTDLWVEGGYTESTAGLARVKEAIHINDIRPYIVDVGNNGELSGSGDYWTTEDDVESLFTTTIPEATKTWKKKRILLYLHGGLNSEVAVAQRVLAFRDVMLKNEIYPVHIMWETGVMESLRSIIGDFFTDADDRAGSVGSWLKKFRDGLVEAKDRTFELTVARPGSALWREMKENARLASRHPAKRGAVQIIAQKAAAALKNLAPADRKDWEIHIVGHSAGSIFVGHALPALTSLGLPIRTIQLMAPAITIADYKALYSPFVDAGKAPAPSVYVLSESGELDDDVGPYGKSLLYLVSNAFEGKRGVPLLGVYSHLKAYAGGADSLLAKKIDGWPALVVCGEHSWNRRNPAQGAPVVSSSDSHGGFDNDHDTLNSVLWRILSQYPSRPFEIRDLQYG